MRWIDRVEILAEDGSIESEELQLGLSQLSRWICSTAGFEVCFHTLHMLNDSRSRFSCICMCTIFWTCKLAADILYDIVVEYLKRFLGKLL